MINDHLSIDEETLIEPEHMALISDDWLRLMANPRDGAGAPTDGASAAAAAAAAVVVVAVAAAVADAVAWIYN